MSDVGRLPFIPHSAILPAGLVGGFTRRSPPFTVLRFLVRHSTFAVSLLCFPLPFWQSGPMDAWSRADGKGRNAPADAWRSANVTGPKRGSKSANSGPIPTKNGKKVEKSARFGLTHLDILAPEPPWS